VKIEVESNEEEDEEENVEEEEEEEEEDEIIDLDEDALNNPVQEESKKGNNANEKLSKQMSPVVTMSNYAVTVQNTEPFRKKKGEYFTPKDTSTIGKLFINNTNAATHLHTEDNATSQNGNQNGPAKTDQNPRTVLSKLAEIYGQKYLKSGMAKASFYEYLMHDEHIQKFIDKHNLDNVEKVHSFIQRNKEFLSKKNMKLKEKVNKYNEEICFTCHGKPNNKEMSPEKVRSPEHFLADNYKFLDRREEKINGLRTKIVEETNKNLQACPNISDKSKKIAEKKIGENKEVHNRLFTEKIKKQKKSFV